MVVPRRLLAMLNRIREFKVRPDDIFIVSYPKCGTTLTMEMVWLITHNMDVESAKGRRGARCAFLEGPAITWEKEDDWEEYYNKLDLAGSPRVFNTHLRLDMLPRWVKTLSLTR